MKVAINNYCNSKCPYCFAGNMGINKSTNIRFEDYVTVLDEMVKINDPVLTILGGEPTLHPQFKEILKITNQYIIENNWDFAILSNGVELGEFVDELLFDNTYLINVNSKETLQGEKNYNKMINSLSKLEEKNCVFKNRKITLGCNLCYEIDDYSFFWNVVDKFKCHRIRLSVASPQNNDFLYNRDSYFKIMKEKFMNFIYEGIKRQVEVGLDCSLIPPCYFESDELTLVSQFCIKTFDKIGGCQVVTQVMPDLSMSCCFGDKDFKNLKQKNQFSGKEVLSFDEKAEENRKKITERHYMKKCKKCKLKEYGWCTAGCFGFKDGISDDKN